MTVEATKRPVSPHVTAPLGDLGLAPGSPRRHSRSGPSTLRNNQDTGLRSEDREEKGVPQTAFHELS